jgi:phosphatidylinositol-3-phosphatase
MKLAAVTVLAVLGFFVGSLVAASAGAGKPPSSCHAHHGSCPTTTTASSATTASPTISTTSVPLAVGPCGSLSSQKPSPGLVRHVVWVWMENHSYSEIVGNSSAPYINQLASQCGLATNYYAVAHPSLPNYIAATSGSTQGITDDNPPSSHPLSVTSIFGQVSGGSYEQSMPSNCDQTDSNSYAVKHNPEAYYTTISTSCRQNDVPLSSFNPAAPPSFSFVTPNLCNDMHDCSVQTGDSWLSSFIPTITSTADYQAGRTAVFITWDEDDSSASNHVATVVLSTWTAPGTRSSTSFTHYSLLRTAENMLGVGALGNAAKASSMEAAFNLP